MLRCCPCPSHCVPRYLDAGKVMALRKEFLSKDDGLSLHEFVFVMKNFLRAGDLAPNTHLHTMSDTVLVSNLCELFEQVRRMVAGVLVGRACHACCVVEGRRQHSPVNGVHGGSD